MSAEVFNIYVEKLVNSVTELTKANILQSAQLTYYERINTSLTAKVEELEKSLEKALNKAETKLKKTADVTEF
jgi:hypothetical protein